MQHLQLISLVMRYTVEILLLMELGLCCSSTASLSSNFLKNITQHHCKRIIILCKTLNRLNNK